MPRRLCRGDNRHDAREAADRLTGGETVADSLMNRLALRIAAATLFSADIDDDADAIGRAVTGALAAFPARRGQLVRVERRPAR